MNRVRLAAAASRLHLVRVPSIHLEMRSFSLQRIALACLLAVVASCRNPQADALLAQQMREIGDELNNSHQETAVMHEQIDSLRIVVARQDTLLRQLAGLAGVPVPLR